MKIILVPTDFSASAENAMVYAGHLARKLDASVLLLHVYQIPISMNDVPVMMVSAEELRHNAEQGLDRSREILEQQLPGLAVKTESRLGDINEEVNDVCQKVKPIFIVVGKHGASGVERLLFGSTSLSIIRHAKVPVIAVPDSTQDFHIHQIGLAIDGNGAGGYDQEIRQFAHKLNARLHLIYVQPDGRPVEKPSELIASLGASYHAVIDHEFIHGIQGFTESHDIDLLVILPHKHSLMDRLFFKTHTKELMQKLSLPILCFPQQ